MCKLRDASDGNVLYCKTIVESVGEDMGYLEEIIELLFVSLRERGSWLRTSGEFKICSYYG